MNPEDTLPPQRRSDDTRIALLEQRMASFETMVGENTKMTREVLDTLRAFKMLGAVAKWGTVIGGAVTGAYHAVQQFFQR